MSLAAVVLSGCASTTASTSSSAPPLGTDASTSASHGDLSGEEYALAVGVARQEVRREKVTVTSATATVGSARLPMATSAAYAVRGDC